MKNSSMGKALAAGAAALMYIFCCVHGSVATTVGKSNEKQLSASAAAMSGRQDAQHCDYGDRIIFGSTAEASNLIPYIAIDNASREIFSQIFVAPLRYDKNLRIEPYAAESYSVEDDGRLLRFTLRKGILWEDGTELTADDVEFTWRVAIDPRTASPYAEDFLAVKEFRKTGRYTFEARYDKFLARSLISWMQAILPKHILEGRDLRNTPFSRRPVGAGPYRLKSWEPGSRITLEASPTYFKGRPCIAEVVYRVIPDVSTMFLETKAGKVDVINLTPQQYLRQTNGPLWDAEYRKYRFLSFGYSFMGFNMRHPYFQDVRVRRAVSRAIDREAIVQGVLLGQGVPAFGPYKPGSWAYHPGLVPPKRDVAEAKALLAEAGFTRKNADGILEKDGKPFAFTLLTNQGNELRILTATVIQSQLREVGIDVRIRTTEWAAFIKEFVEKGRFDAVILGWTITQDPDIYDVWHSSKAKTGGLNFTHYKNAEVDSLLERARSAPDMEERKKLYYRLQEVLDREQPYCFLFVPYALPAVQTRFRGIEPALAGIMHNFDRWWAPAKEQRYAP